MGLFKFQVVTALVFVLLQDSIALHLYLLYQVLVVPQSRFDRVVVLLCCFIGV